MLTETMEPLEEHLLDCLDQLWSALSKQSGKEFEFDMAVFKSMSVEGKIAYLLDIQRWFISRDGMSTEMERSGVIKPGFARDFSVSASKYIETIREK